VFYLDSGPCALTVSSPVLSTDVPSTSVLFSKHCFPNVLTS